MNRRLFTGVFFLVSLCFIAGESYACPILKAIIAHPDPKWVMKRVEIGFDGSGSFCKDGTIVDCDWTLPGAYDVNYYKVNCPKDCVSCKFGTPGPRTVRLKVRDNKGRTDTDTCTVYVVAVDVDMSGVSEDDEETIGGYVGDNRDDDNLNGIPDIHDTTVNGENDLVEIGLSVEPNNLPGQVELNVGWSSAFKVWRYPDKRVLIIPSNDPCHWPCCERWPPSAVPKKLYLEGNGGGQYTLSLLYIDPNGNYVASDGVKYTGAGVELYMDGVEDSEYKTEEETIGGFIGLNDDDDNNNGIPDCNEGGPVINENDLKLITLAYVFPGSGNVTLKALAGGEKIRIWESPIKEGNSVSLPATFPGIPSSKSLYVEGIQTSLTPRDITLALEYPIGGKTFYDKIKATVVKVNLTSTDLYGTVPEPNEETPGAFIHFNLDNDDSSDNSVEGPKRPGADYANDTTTVTGEDDLKSLTMTMIPSLSEGIVVLTNTSSGEIWKSSTKGTGNRLLAYGSLSWDLSDPNKKSEFLSLCASPLYMEGAAGTGGEIALRYYSPGGSMVHLDKIKYTFIAADCGDQPRTEAEDIYVWSFDYQVWVLISGHKHRDWLEGEHNVLIRCEYSATQNIAARLWSSGKRCTIPEYNCIAYSVDETNIWYDETDIAEDYGDKDGIFELTDMDDFYQKKKGWSLITSGTDAEKAAQAEAMYYSNYHAARKKSCGCGAGKWIMYESKLGQWERIEHVWDQLNDSRYGTPIRFYK